MSRLLINRIKLFILFLFIAAPLFPQSWNDIIQTSIPFSVYSKLDLCTNRKGNNVLITYRNQPTYYLKYYLFNSSGSVIRSYTFENQEVEFASIDGNNEKIYVVYKLGNIIKTRKSINGGSSWTNIVNIDIGNNTCNNIDIIWGKDDNALHIVWATQDVLYDYKTYYRKLPSNDIWVPIEYVTDGNYVGGFPTVSKSSNRVHVSYNTGQTNDPISNVADAYSRDKYYNTWQTRQLVFPSTSKSERIHAGSSKLFDFYYEEMGWYCNLRVKERNFNEIDWSLLPTVLDYIADPEELLSAANTNDGKSHIVYIINGGVGYRSYEGTDWSSESSVLNTYYSPRISSVSNDLYVVSGGNYVFYRQYDATPLAPAGLTLINYYGHPRLQWTANSEPDLVLYTIYRNLSAGAGFEPIATTSALLYDDPDVTINPPGGPAGYDVYYKITATDLSENESGNSNIVRCNVAGNDPEKIISGDLTSAIYDYKLDQNFPNPFNPSTSINYQLKEKGFVSLRVYDMIGKEVSVLVNETKDRGEYSVMFNAANLPSGIYIYSLRVNDFIDNHKMILLK